MKKIIDLTGNDDTDTKVTTPENQYVQKLPRRMAVRGDDDRINYDFLRNNPFMKKLLGKSELEKQCSLKEESEEE